MGRLQTIITSSSGNIFRVTGHLCGEFTGHRWIPRTKASDAELWIFSLICAWISDWVNNSATGDLRRHRAYYDVTVMRASLQQRLVHCSGVTWASWRLKSPSNWNVCSTVYSCQEQRKHSDPVSLAFCVKAIQRWPVVSPHKRPLMRSALVWHDVTIKQHGDVWKMNNWKSIGAPGVVSTNMD